MAPRDRDVLVRKDTPVGGLAVPHHVAEPGTGVVEGEALRQVRESRPPSERMAHLELRVDGVVADLGEIKGDIGELRGDVHGIKGMLERDLEERRAERQARLQTETNQVGLEKVRLNSRAKIILGILGVISAAIGGAITLLAKALS
jgi:hypothetical protein